MRTIFISILAILFSVPIAMADEYTIGPAVPDYQPGDGLFEAGSPQNPYVIKNEYGDEVGEITSESPDLTPGDGFMTPGSYENPWILTTPD